MIRGRKIGEGRLRVDAKKAIAKLRDYQLPDPTFWALEVIRSAVALGAARVWVESDADDVWIFWEGAAPEAETLGHVFDELVSPAGEGHGKRLLAIGVNTALSLSPSFVDLYTFAEGVAQKARFTPRSMERAAESEEGFIAPPAEKARRPDTAPSVGGAVHTKRPFGLMVLNRFFSKERLPELALIRDRCRDLPVPLTVDGSRIETNALLRVPVLDIAEAFIEISIGNPHLRPGCLLVEFAEHGVVMSRRTVAIADTTLFGHVMRRVLPLRVYVNSPKLPANASRSGLRSEDSPVAETLAAKEAMLARFAAAASSELPRRPELAEALALVLATLTLPRHVHERENIPSELLPLFDLPVLRNAVGDAVALADLDDLSVVHTDEEPLPRELEPWFRQTLWAPGGVTPFFIDEAKTTKERVRAVKSMLLHRDGFMEQDVVPAKVASGDVIAVESAAGYEGGIKGEAALVRTRRSPSEGGRVTLHYKERPIARMSIESIVPFDAVIACEALTPTPDFRGVVDNVVLQRCMAVARTAAHAALRKQRPPTEERAAWVAWARLVRGVQAELATHDSGSFEEAQPVWIVVQDDGPECLSLKELRALITKLDTEGRPVVVTAPSNQAPPLGQPLIVRGADEAPYLAALFGVESVVTYAALHPATPAYPALAEGELRLYFSGEGYRGFVSSEGGMRTRSHRGHVIDQESGDHVPMRVWLDDDRLVPGNLADVAYAPAEPTLESLEEQWLGAALAFLSGESPGDVEVGQNTESLTPVILRALARAHLRGELSEGTRRRAGALVAIPRHGAEPIRLGDLHAHELPFLQPADVPAEAIPDFTPLLCDEDTADAIGVLIGRTLNNGVEELQARERVLAEKAMREEFLSRPVLKEATPPGVAHTFHGFPRGTLWFAPEGAFGGDIEVRCHGRKVCDQWSSSAMDYGVTGVVELPEVMVEADFAQIRTLYDHVLDNAVEEAIPGFVVACAATRRTRLSARALDTLYRWIDRNDDELSIAHQVELCAAPLFEGVAGGLISVDDASTPKQIRVGRIEGDWIPAPEGKRDKAVIRVSDKDGATKLKKCLERLSPEQKATNYSKALLHTQTKRRLAMNQLSAPTVQASTDAVKMPLVAPFQGMGEIALVDTDESSVRVYERGALVFTLSPRVLPPVHIAVESPALARDARRAKTATGRNAAARSMAKKMCNALLENVVVPAIEDVPRPIRKRIQRALCAGALDDAGPVAQAPLFLLHDGGMTSYARLREQVELFGKVWAVDASIHHGAPLDERRLVVRVSSRADIGSFGKRLPLYWAPEELRLDAMARDNQRRALAAGPLPSEFDYLARMSRGDADGSVQVGLLPSRQDEVGVVHFFADGAPVGTLSLPGWPFIAFVSDARLSPNRTWSEPMPGEVRDLRLQGVRELRGELLSELRGPPPDALASVPSGGLAEWVGHLHLERSTTPGSLTIQVGEEKRVVPSEGSAGALPVHGRALFPGGGTAAVHGGRALRYLVDSGYELLITSLANNLRAGSVAEEDEDVALAHLVLSIAVTGGTDALGDMDALPPLSCFFPEPWTFAELGAHWASPHVGVLRLRKPHEAKGKSPTLLDDGSLTSAAIQELLRGRLHTPVFSSTSTAPVLDEPDAHALAGLAQDLRNMLSLLGRQARAVEAAGSHKRLLRIMKEGTLELPVNATNVAMEAARLSRSVDYERALRLLALHAAEVHDRSTEWPGSNVASATLTLLDDV